MFSREAYSFSVFINPLEKMVTKITFFVGNNLHIHILASRLFRIKITCIMIQCYVARWSMMASIVLPNHNILNITLTTLSKSMFIIFFHTPC